MLRISIERAMRQRSLEPREGTVIYLMNVPGATLGLQSVKSVGLLCRGFWSLRDLGELLHSSWDTAKERWYDGVWYQWAPFDAPPQTSALSLLSL